jgi:hypothetical protein
MIGVPEAETRAIIAEYDAQLPFVKLPRIAQQMAVRNGHTELYERGVNWNCTGRGYPARVPAVRSR